MPSLPDHLRPATSPLAPAGSVVVNGSARFTILTEALVRCEFSPSGVFEDRATQTVWHRDLPTPGFRMERDGERVRIFTSRIQLEHTGGPFSPETLSVKQLAGGYHSVWRPGQEPQSRFAELVGLRSQLGGTARTLDAVDGATELEPGLLNELGIASLDDSASLALDDEGWVAQREPGASDVYVFGHGHDYPAAVADFYRIAGPQPVLPRHVLGNWWSRFHAYTQAEYQELIGRFEDEELPFSVAVVDMDWHLTDVPERFGNGWTGYTWNPELFPDHRGFLDWLHEHGLTVSLNVHPAEGVRAFEEAYPRMAAAMGVEAASELPISFDFADKRFITAYFDELHHPLEAEGVDFWWLDWQQGASSRIPGLDPLWMLNHLHFLDAGRDGRRPMTFSRYAGPGSHRYPVGFSGDTVISWASLAFQPYFTATASNIGYGWWSHDIGGHMFGTKDDELATRWLQFGVFSPINRLHSSNGTFNGKEPWRHHAIAAKIQGDFLRLRHRMVPWLFTENVVGSRELRPLIRPMYWHDPEVLAANRVDNQYWFGRDLVVAPITVPCLAGIGRAPVATWLPEGRWTDLFTNLTYTGGRQLTMYRPLSQIPVLARAGAIIPLAEGRAPRVGIPEGLEIRVVAGAAGEYTLIEDDDRAEAREVRTRISYDDATGTLTIHPAEGAVELLPTSRTITGILLGAGDEQRVELGEVTTATGATARFEAPQRLGNHVAERVFAFLDEAQIEMLTKERCLAVVQRSATPARAIAELSELGLDEHLLGVLRELVLALA